MSQESLEVAKIWAACAWADGEMHPKEAEALQRLVDASDDLSGEDRTVALGYITAAPDADLGAIASLSEAARQGVYRAARGIVKLDRVIDPKEEELLARLRAQLKLDEATLRAIEAE